MPELRGPWLASRELVAVLPLAVGLCAWSLRFAGRVGALLAALTLAQSVWLLIAVRFGDAGLAPAAGFGFV